MALAFLVPMNRRDLSQSHLHLVGLIRWTESRFRLRVLDKPEGVERVFRGCKVNVKYDDPDANCGQFVQNTPVIRPTDAYLAVHVRRPVVPA